jgi:hypothetical protein
MVALSADLDALANLNRGELVARWRATFDAPPPKHLSAPFMIKAVGFEMQCKTLGGVSKLTERRLKAIARGGVAKTPTAAFIKPGTHLMREWNGRTYQVEVTSDGYVFDGTTYRSLSAIAKRITGAHWSGPRFFGLAT